MRIDLSQVVYKGEQVYLVVVNQVKELDVCMGALTEAAFAYSATDPENLSPSEVLLEITHAIQSPEEAFLYATAKSEFLGFAICTSYKIGRNRTRFEPRHVYAVPWAPRRMLIEGTKEVIALAEEVGCHTFSFATRMKGNRAAALHRKLGILGLNAYTIRFEKELNHGR